MQVLAEFFRQGDLEASMGLPYSPLCDRHTTRIADSQIGPCRPGPPSWLPGGGSRWLEASSTSSWSRRWPCPSKCLSRWWSPSSPSAPAPAAKSATYDLRSHPQHPPTPTKNPKRRLSKSQAFEGSGRQIVPQKPGCNNASGILVTPCIGTLPQPLFPPSLSYMAKKR